MMITDKIGEDKLRANLAITSRPKGARVDGHVEFEYQCFPPINRQEDVFDVRQIKLTNEANW
jgi:hypothetical protein